MTFSLLHYKQFFYVSEINVISALTILHIFVATLKPHKTQEDVAKF